jgi:hypothetical protein
MPYFTGGKIPRKNILLVCKQENHSQNRRFLDLVNRLNFLMLEDRQGPGEGDCDFELYAAVRALLC